MREFPVFVPCGQERLAAVMTLPDGDARAVAVLSGVPGSPRSHRHQVWARAAGLLAERGVASIRWESRGLEDSTGSVTHVTMAVTPVEQILAVARFAQRAAGVEPVFGAGNCLAAQSSLALAAEMEECAGAVCILPHVVKPGRMRTVIKRVLGRSGAPGLGGQGGRARPLASVLGRFGLKVRPPIRELLPRALEHGPVLFLYDREHLRGRSRAFSRIESIVGRLSPAIRRRFELRVLPSYGLDRFGTVQSQELTLEAILDWAERCLGGEASPAPVRAGAGDAAAKGG